ncbi:MAG: polyphosphate kinase 1 [Spartobacteria bacterium]|nr:polyphosphate kinase 1 [Spartobacteria bacterium]
MAKTPSSFFNREQSWLEFNQRVLAEALDADVPLLERVKFLAITASNLDEFFMVRVGGLQQLVARRVTKTDPSGMTPQEQLDAISVRVHQMVRDADFCYEHDIQPALAAAGLQGGRPHDFTEEQRWHVEWFFDNEVYPVISPQAVSGPDTFPLIAGLGLNLCVRMANEGEARKPRFANIPIQAGLSRFVSLPTERGYAYMLIEDVIQLYLERLFPGERVLECVAYRITRNADMAVQEDMAADLLSGMQDVLDARRISRCVRLEIDAGVTKTTMDFLRRALKVKGDDIYCLRAPLQFSDFMRMGCMDGFDELQNEQWLPEPSPDLNPKVSVFSEVLRRNILLSHPYEEFDPVIRMIQEAAEDPDVLAIKQILYRTSSDSPIITALRRAAENGKYVTVIVELKARFDEARNIQWARRLEQAGVQVIYGVKGLKTHAKLCIIVRREPDGIVRYMHFGTGNYNERTARIYSDVGYLTCDPDLASDASSFFNAITGYSEPPEFLKLQAAPLGLRDRILELIDGERLRSEQGQKALIMVKVNSLADPKLIEALYKASRAGVKVMLNIRGICCLRPGVKGLSENISVVSIIDRYLEHSRIMYFLHGGDEQVLISSADWMPRNMDRRVELLVPVDDKACRKKLVRILTTYFEDNTKSWTLLPGGSYERQKPAGSRKRNQAQRMLYKRTCAMIDLARKNKPTVFEPHRAPEMEE